MLRRGAFTAALLLLAGFLSSAPVLAQQAFNTDSVAPERFVAAHGRKAVAMGYADSGLEVWGYPLQLVSGYEPGFRAAGATTEINAASLLRRVTYEPDAITRTYIGPDFIIRERLFVPLEEAAAFLTYTVECHHSIDIVIHFTPVLNLMWPASLGGQYTRWDAAASAFILAEETHRYSAFIGSSGAITHDDIMNSAQPGAPGSRVAFALRAGGADNSSVTVVVARNDPGSLSAAARIKDLLRSQPKLEAEAKQHYTSLAAGALRMETPDPAVNQQLAWAQVALDQAWVCDQALGCGLVAGYGPSRGARRPQYDWFFAGDGLIAIDALLSAGEYDRSREALAFIAKYQDANTGMIWHELSQSADPADWASKYPYMFVHVDITFYYLITVERYVAASGDTQFLQQHWAGLEAAYGYCRSLLSMQDGLPRIPAAKEGGNEQDRLSDDLDLSTSWVAASAAFARLAALNEHPAQAEEARHASERAAAATALRYWDDRRGSWIDGYTQSGQPVSRRSHDGAALVRILGPKVMDRGRSDAILDQLASSDFEVDWGTLGVAEDSPRFDPSSYASGSVSAPGTGGIAAVFWAHHRPFTAYGIWSGLLPWGTLDSMGHMHELLAGDFYHQQAESVPEQTWSSAAFLSSALHGLFGLVREPQRLEFSPHMPAAWNRIALENIKVPGGQVAITLARVPQGLELKSDNSGDPVELFFSPEIPLGAHLIGADLDGKPVTAVREAHAQDTHATVTFRLPRGHSRCLIRFEGGVLLSIKADAPLLGDPSKASKITAVHMTSPADRGATLVVEADVWRDAQRPAIALRTSDRPLRVQGGELEPVAEGVYNLVVDPASKASAGSASIAPSSDYRHIKVSVDFAR